VLASVPGGAERDGFKTAVKSNASVDLNATPIGIKLFMCILVMFYYTTYIHFIQICLGVPLNHLSPFLRHPPYAVKVYLECEHTVF
jgi:hypothetical protein